VLFLPSYAAAAWYHKKLPSELQNETVENVVRQAREFARGRYMDALQKGAALSEADRRDVVQQLARFTGLSPEYIDRSNLRVEERRFTKELMMNEKEVIGRYDARLTGPDQDPVSDSADYDPSYTSVLGAFTAAFNQYVRQELNWKTDLPYEVLTMKVQPWNYSGFVNAFVNVSGQLVDGMTANPFMKVLQMNGYYDLATPFFATEYTFDHLKITPELRKNIQFGYCGAGHMLYLKESCLQELHKDMAGIY
jgi:carboxypeptidase C (cathepsin A)